MEPDFVNNGDNWLNCIKIQVGLKKWKVNVCNAIVANQHEELEFKKKK